MKIQRGPALPDRCGEWADSNDVASQLLTLLTSTATSRFLRRKGSFWDSIRAAHQQDRRGNGQRIAVLDSGFDLTLPQLSAAIPAPDTKSRTDQGAAHGTVVALLVREIAPDAELRLWDISDRNQANLTRAKTALVEAQHWNADVVCCSFGFRSNPQLKSPNLATVLSMDADPASVSRAVLDWCRGSPRYDPGGCRSSCAICEVLDSFDAKSPLVVCAGGNDLLDKCPGVHHNALTTGFHRRGVTRGENDTTEGWGLASFQQNLWLDLVIEEIDGFEGTSFASPLIAAFAAVVGPADFRRGVAVRAATEAANMRHLMLKSDELRRILGESDIGDDATLKDNPIRSTKAAYDVATELLPEGHKWYDHRAPTPCPFCSFLVPKLIQNMGLLGIHVGDLELAASVLGPGSSIVPRSPGVRANYAALLRLCAKNADQDPSLRVAYGLNAVVHWLEADRIEGRELYAQFAADTLEEAVALAEKPALPPLDGLTAAEHRLSQPKHDVEVYSGKLASEVLMILGRRQMDDRQFSNAIPVLQKIVDAGDSPLVGMASLHIGVAHILLGNNQDAYHAIAQSEHTDDITAHTYARFNRLLMDRFDWS